MKLHTVQQRLSVTKIVRWGCINFWHLCTLMTQSIYIFLPPLFCYWFCYDFSFRPLYVQTSAIWRVFISSNINNKLMLWVALCLFQWNTLIHEGRVLNFRSNAALHFLLHTWSKNIYVVWLSCFTFDKKNRLLLHSLITAKCVYSMVCNEHVTPFYVQETVLLTSEHHRYHCQKLNLGAWVFLPSHPHAPHLIVCIGRFEWLTPASWQVWQTPADRCPLAVWAGLLPWPAGSLQMNSLWWEPQGL